MSRNVWWAIILAILFVDLGSKEVAKRTLQFEKPISVISKIHFTLRYNTGLNLGRYATQTDYVFWKVTTLSMGITIVAFVFRKFASYPLLQLSTAICVGGTWANLVGRYIDGAVVDFIELSQGSERSLTFNIADCAIMLSGLLWLAFVFSHIPRIVRWVDNLRASRPLTRSES